MRVPQMPFVTDAGWAVQIILCDASRWREGPRRAPPNPPILFGFLTGIAPGGCGGLGGRGGGGAPRRAGLGTAAAVAGLTLVLIRKNKRH